MSKHATTSISRRDLVKGAAMASAATALLGTTTGTALAEEADGKMTPGLYTATARGYMGDNTVLVRVSEDAILDVVVTSSTDEPAYLTKFPIEQVPASIVREQSTNVDGVAGATFTSMSIKTAVEDALAQAGGAGMFSAAPARPEKTQAPAEEFDVLVVGGGVAGMVAALGAKYDGWDLADGGLSVALVEKLGFLGGSLPLACGGWSVAAPLSGPLSDEYIQYQLDRYASHCVDFPCNEDLLLNVLNASGRTTLDLHGIGLIMQTAGLDDPNATYGAAEYTIMPARDNFQMPPRMTSARNAEILSLQLANIGVDVRTNTAAKELIVEGGEVVGARVEGPDSVYEIRAKKVVLASGGFSQNREMIEQYAPRDATAATCANGGAYGDGIRMATEIGATVVGDRLDGNPCIGGNYSVYNDFYAKRVWEHGMRVNKEGKMWEDSHPLTGYTANIWEYVDLTAQPGGVAYCIFGSNNTYLDMFKNAQYADEVMTEAETLEELAEKIGVPADALLESAEAYNQIPAEDMIATLANYYMAPAEGEEVDFTVKEGPFYAFKIRATTCASVAGLKIDGECRVLDGATGQPIPNLYAAGEVANGNLFQYYIGGWGIAGAMVTGHICGDNVKAAIRG